MKLTWVKCERVIGEKLELLNLSTSVTLAQEAKYESSSFIGISAS